MTEKAAAAAEASRDRKSLRPLLYGFLLANLLALWFVAFFVFAHVAGLDVSGGDVVGEVRVARTPDLASLLLGAATLVLTGCAVVLALAGFFGWSAIRGLIDQAAQKAVDAKGQVLQKSYLEPTLESKLEEVRELNHAFSLALQATVYGYLFKALDKPEARKVLDVDVVDRFIDSAIHLARAALEKLDEGSRRYKFTVNNLAYFYTLRGWLADSKQVFALEQKLRHYLAEGRDFDYMTTLILILIRYHSRLGNRDAALQEARELLDELQEPELRGREGRTLMQTTEIEFLEGLLARASSV